jgi:hypothetical protein
MNIQSLNEMDLIRSLWANQKVAAFFTQTFDGQRLPLPTMPTDVEIERQRSPKGYYDYVNGRAIKLDVQNSSAVDGSHYDSIAGTGVFKRVVDGLIFEKE